MYVCVCYCVLPSHFVWLKCKQSFVIKILNDFFVILSPQTIEFFYCCFSMYVHVPAFVCALEWIFYGRQSKKLINCLFSVNSVGIHIVFMFISKKFARANREKYIAYMCIHLPNPQQKVTERNFRKLYVYHYIIYPHTCAYIFRVL